ncbi:MAG: hypothetical protein AAF652_19845 [Cyanobacteria bacterium P01_C01_bin.72]
MGEWADSQVKDLPQFLDEDITLSGMQLLIEGVTPKQYRQKN